MIEPTPEMIDAGAQRLASFESDSVWPDSWDALQVENMRNIAERVIRSALQVAPWRSEPIAWANGEEVRAAVLTIGNRFGAYTRRGSDDWLDVPLFAAYQHISFEQPWENPDGPTAA